MELVDALINFNLTRQEAVIYLTLCVQGELTGYEAAKLTGISRSNSYTALAALVDKGAAYISEGTATKYVPVSIAEFCNNRIYNLQLLKQKLIMQAPEMRSRQDGYLTIKGESHIIDKIRNMLNQAEKRLYISLSHDKLKLFLPELETAVKKDLKVVVITDHPLNLTGAIMYRAKRQPNQIRLIIDSHNVLTGELDGPYSTCLYSQKSNLVELFKESLSNEIELIEISARS